jgi:hypothetical protein
VLHWFEAAEQHINESCRRDPNMWCECRYLYKRMLDMEARHGGLTPRDIRPNVTKFLAKEAQLGVPHTEEHPHSTTPPPDGAASEWSEANHDD